MNWTLLQNSLLVSGCATTLALAFGVLASLSLAGLAPRWRHIFLLIATVGASLPPFLVTSCWLHLLGHTGIWRDWLPFNIYSFGGTVWILTLLTWPVTLLLVLAEWKRVQTGLLESDPAVRGWVMIRCLLLPLAQAGLRHAAVLTFVLALNNFAVPAILQTKVYPAEMWISFNTTFNYQEAIALGWPLLVAPLLLLAWTWRRNLAWPALDGPSSPALFRRQLGVPWFCIATVVLVGLSLLTVALPLIQLAGTSRTWLELSAAFAAGKLALWNSFFFAAASATFCVLFGLLASRHRAGMTLWLPFLVPGLMIGLLLSFALNRPITSLFYQSVGIVFFGLLLHYSALSWTVARQSLKSTDNDLAGAAKVDGASGWSLFRSVQWPQIAPRIAALWYITYLLCLWDVETLILVIPPGAETLAMRVFNLLHYGHNTQVNALCLLLLTLGFLPLLLWYAWQYWQNRWARSAFLLLCLAMFSMGCQPTSTNESRIESTLFSSVKIIGSRGTGLSQFNKPRSVAVDASDNLYVVDMTGKVQKFSPEGEFLASWQMPETDKGKPKGMCLDGAGNVIVIEPHYSRINHLSPESKWIAHWGTHGTNAGQLMFPRSAIVNSRGDIFLSEYGVVDRIQVFSPLGTNFIRSFGHAGAGNGEFNRPEGLGMDQDDRLYVADSCNHRIQIFSNDGSFLRTYGRPGSGLGELSYPYDIRIDTTGLQFVCEFGNSRVQVFDDKGQTVEILGQMGSAPGQFSNPWGLALDSKGNLYVADSRNHRVQKFIRKHPVHAVKTATSRKEAS